jgi:hypothetical protein
MPTYHQRQRNVQQQNAVTEAAIRRRAVYWRKNDVPEALRSAGVARGVAWEKTIVLDLGIDEPGMPSICGSLLSQDERFIDFELDTDADHRIVLQVYQWVDVTDRQNVNSHNRGIGAGSGVLSIRVLRDLNTCTGI